MIFFKCPRPTTAVILVCLIKLIYVAPSQANYNIEAVPNSHASLGEGPHWDIATKSLFYVDVDAGRLLRYDPRKNKIYACKIKDEQFASFVIPIKNEANKFVVGSGRRVIIVHWNGKAEVCTVDSTLFEVQMEPKYEENRFNDGKCDSRGRLFAGTFKPTGDIFAQRYGELYKYEKGGNVEVVMTNVGVSNGLAWNKASNKFYYTDTADFEVKEFDYNLENGSVSNPRVVFKRFDDLTNQNSIPDGTTIDSEGYIYMAIGNNGTVVKVDPRTSKVLLEIKLPVTSVTSVAWGGPKLDVLFVTTAAFDAPAPAGTLYKVTGLGAKGLPMHKIQL